MAQSAASAVDARRRVTDLARTAGFFAVRFARVNPPTPFADAFRSWIDAGRHGSMHYLERHQDVRTDPRQRLSTARSAAVFALAHHHRRPPDPGGRTGVVARYAWGRDYHNLVGKRLRRLRRALRGEGIGSWGGVDTAPILERSWAHASGMGFTGKSCVQILPATSSWFFLAVLFLDVEVLPDPPITRDHCGRCTRCLTACPTQAYVGPRSLDARRCIAYWTIEARDLAPREIRPSFGRWVFGCDVCQEVCPHNHDPPRAEEDDLLPRNAWLDLDALLSTPDANLMERFRGTPLRRPGAAGLKRNALIALGNLQDSAAIPTIRAHGLVHPDPVVRGASVWALARLGMRSVATLRDPDPLVQAEIVAASESR